MPHLLCIVNDMDLAWMQGYAKDRYREFAGEIETVLQEVLSSSSRDRSAWLTALDKHKNLARLIVRAAAFCKVAYTDGSGKAVIEHSSPIQGSCERHLRRSIPYFWTIAVQIP